METKHSVLKKEESEILWCDSRGCTELTITLGQLVWSIRAHSSEM